MHNNMKKFFFLIIVLILSFTGLYYWFKPLKPTVLINGTKFTVELAITQSEITQGLSGRESLATHSGMIFLMNHKEQYSFWMKDMRFPLDFVWIDGNRIVDITTHVPTKVDSTVPVIQPRVAADKILELNAGEVDKAGIKIGDTVLFNK